MGDLAVRSYRPTRPLKPASACIFHVPYDKNGDPLKKISGETPNKLQLDLRPGAKIKVTRGVGKNFIGTVYAIKENGDFLLQIPLQRENHPQRGKTMSMYTLGRWWVKDAIEWTAKYLP